MDRFVISRLSALRQVPVPPRPPRLRLHMRHLASLEANCSSHSERLQDQPHQEREKLLALLHATVTSSRTRSANIGSRVLRCVRTAEGCLRCLPQATQGSRRAVDFT